jgi:hypothetical protein
LLFLDLGLLIRHLVVDSDVKVKQMVDRVGLEGFLITPLLPGQSQQTVLLAPVTKVVHSGDLPASRLIQRSEETTNDGTSEMTSVERLGDVGRRELDNHSLPARVGVAGVSETIVGVLSIVAGLLSDGGDQHVGELVGLEEEGNEGTRSSGLLNKRRLGKLGDPFFSKLLRLLALHTESRHSENSITLVECLSPLDGGVDDTGINTSDGRQEACDVRSVDVDRIGVGMTVGVRFDTVDTKLLELVGESVTVDRHCAYIS